VKLCYPRAHNYKWELFNYRYEHKHLVGQIYVVIGCYILKKQKKTMYYDARPETVSRQGSRHPCMLSIAALSVEKGIAEKGYKQVYGYPFTKPNPYFNGHVHTLEDQGTSIPFLHLQRIQFTPEIDACLNIFT